MTKYTKMLSRVVTISTYAIIFCVIGNMVMPALIVESVHAQTSSSSSSATAQPKLSASDQKALDKAQSDAKAAMYKDWGLTKSEIAFSDSFDMDAINQKVDKYVTYDKNGVASLNANAFRKDGTVKLSKSNTELAISIANKKISQYNKSIAAAVSASSKSGNNSSYKSTSKIASRGLETDLVVQSNNKSQVNAAASSCSPIKYFRTYRYWWGYDYKIALENCAIEAISTSRTYITSVSTALLVICMAGVVTGPICGISWGMFNVGVNLVAVPLILTNRLCGYRGAELGYTMTWYPLLSYPSIRCPN
jgi:hypothetical protein